MRQILNALITVGAICLAAGQATAQEANTARVVGKFQVTFLKQQLREVPEPFCTYLKPMPQSVRDDFARAGMTVAGDGCMGCSVSPVMMCNPRKSLRLEKRRGDGFAIKQRNGGTFKMSNNRAKWVLQRYCRQAGAQLAWTPPDFDRASERHEERWFMGRCQ